MTENYPSAAEVVRNISDLKAPIEVLVTTGKFRIIKISPPFFGGYEFWVINERGFLWEPALDFEAAAKYLSSSEALEYQTESSEVKSPGT